MYNTWWRGGALAAAGLLMLLGCSNSGGAASSEQLEELQTQVAALRDQIEQLSDDLTPPPGAPAAAPETSAPTPDATHLEELLPSLDEFPSAWSDAPFFEMEIEGMSEEELHAGFWGPCGGSQDARLAEDIVIASRSYGRDFGETSMLVTIVEYADPALFSRVFDDYLRQNRGCEWASETTSGMFAGRDEVAPLPLEAELTNGVAADSRFEPTGEGGMAGASGNHSVSVRVGSLRISVEHFGPDPDEGLTESIVSGLIERAERHTSADEDAA